jgi:hypothetical protein
VTGEIKSIQSLWEPLARLLKGDGGVSAFIRLHPLADLVQLGVRGIEDVSVTTRGVTGVMELDRLDDELSVISKNIRRDVRRLRRDGYTTVHYGTDAHWRWFIACYRDEMTRKGAAEVYLPDDNHFEWLRSHPDVQLVVTTDRAGEPAAGQLFVESSQPGIVDYYLAASDPLRAGAGAAKLGLIDAAMYYKRQGFNTLHLGGGVGGRRDSLFAFKRRFSSTLAEFRTLDWIIDRAVYTELAEGRDRGSEGFFPAYRR